MVFLYKILLFLLAANFAARFVRSQEVDYCNVTSCGPWLHVMCEFPAPADKSVCSVSNQSQPLTKKEKTDLLDWHNTVRSNVTRTTSGMVLGGGFDRPVNNMLRMKWSTELERFAQRWADQCIVAVQREHDGCRNTMLSDKKKQAGQLVYIYNSSSTQSAEVGSIMDKLKHKWTQAPLKMPEGGEQISGPRESSVQETWPFARTLGCGRSQFSYQNQSYVMVVCDYGAAVGPSGGSRVGAARGLAPALLVLVTGTALAF